MDRFFVYQPTSTSLYAPSGPTLLLPATLQSCIQTQGRLFEASLIEWSKQFCRHNAIFVDVGAHTGTYSVSLASLCKQVWAFEPQRSTFYALCGSVALSGLTNVRCVPCALADKHNDSATLYVVSEDGGGSSLLNQSNAIRKESVGVRTMDSTLFDIGIPVSFIKIDVEGMEEQVLQGALNILRRDHPVILFEDNSGRRHHFTVLSDNGYRVVPVTGFPNMFLAS